MEDLANILWRALSGSHRQLSVGSDRARRYSRELPALFGFSDPSRPDFDGIAAHCEAGDHLYCTEWTGDAPMGWKVEVDTKVVAMIWKGARPAIDDSLAATRLTESHVEEMRALARLTRPGPFARQPMGLGEWWGVLDAGRIVAMAGERLHAGTLHEVSGICTLPQFQRRGLAGRLTQAIVRRQLDRGETPFLHVMPENTGARALYERLGFDTVREAPLRVVTRL
ncbi:MAG TPA: GNAT family N-acetyltransferase [Usitatibacter sp.]|nr:GNAT family N-acetyltransferase [Usitatibacter sp.]